MALDNFRKTSMRIDKANQRFIDYQNAKAGDVNGRELLVQITNNGVVEDQTGTTLKLNWQHENGNQGSTSFNAVDIKQGKYSLYYPKEMLYKGSVDASIEIISNGQTTNTMNFKIIVHADVFNGEAGTVNGVFISLADVNKKLDDREKEYVELKERQTSVENQFDAVQQELTGKDIISAPEIIAARNGESNLKTRLDDEHAQVTAQLAQTASNFQSTEEDEQAIIGDQELVSSGGWSLGNGWTGDFSTGFIHSTGSTEPLIYSMSNVANKMYQIEVTVHSPSTTRESNSGWTMSIGGSEPFEMYEGNFTEHTYVRGIRAGSENDFVIAPESNFDGAIKNVSIKEITGQTSPTFVIRDSNDAHVLEITSTGADKRNVFIGRDIARYNTTGNRNVAIGDRAFADNTSGFWNVAIGDEAMMNNTVGSRSVAIGHIALRHNTVGHRNIAIGPFTLEQNTTGTNNIAIGVDPMQFGKDAHFNIALGTSTLTRIENGEDNIALGRGAGSKVLGNNNIAIGRSTMANNENGDNSIAIGGYALSALTGGSNVALGYRSLWQMVTGNANTALGRESLQNLTEGSSNIAIGHGVGNTLTDGSGNVLIGGNVLTPNASNKINIGEHIYGDKTSHKTYLGGRKEPTAILELRQGTGLSGGAPLKFNEGNLLSSPEAGTFEFKDGVLYFTAVAGQRKEVSLV